MVIFFGRTTGLPGGGVDKTLMWCSVGLGDKIFQPSVRNVTTTYTVLLSVSPCDITAVF